MEKLLSISPYLAIGGFILVVFTMIYFCLKGLIDLRNESKQKPQTEPADLTRLIIQKSLGNINIEFEKIKGLLAQGKCL